MGKYFKPKKYNFHTADAVLDYDETFAPIVGNGGFEFCDGHSVLHIAKPKYVDDINFYTHEFSEMSILASIRKCTRKWRKMVKFKGLSKVDVSHLLSPYAYPNKCCLFPDPTIRKPYKQLLRNLTAEELKIRRLIGENW